MPLLLANWKLIFLGLLLATVALFYNLWRHEVKAFAEFKAEVTAAGVIAKKEKDRVEELHRQTAITINKTWTEQLPRVRASAIANFSSRYPSGLCAPSSGVPVSPNADSPKGADGTGGKQVAAGTPSDDFINSCALDAAKVDSWQTWSRLNQLKVE